MATFDHHPATTLTGASWRDYAGFLHAKTQWDNASGFTATYLPDFLFGFQHDLVDWSVQMGRSAIFADWGRRPCSSYGRRTSAATLAAPS
jgi:hypothetical protein